MFCLSKEGYIFFFPDVSISLYGLCFLRFFFFFFCFIFVFDVKSFPRMRWFIYIHEWKTKNDSYIWMGSAFEWVVLIDYKL